jgi:sugar (pentulose or hexulose) kinase
MSYFIGLGISTSATKAMLMDEQGKVMAVASVQHDFESPILCGSFCC